jgi:hypothetical protein
MPKSTWSFRRCARRQRSAHRVVRRTASHSCAAGTSAGGHSTRHQRGTVDVRLKRHALVVDAGPRCQAEDLETATVGQNGALPGHEPVQTTQLRHRLGAGAQGQVVGIAEQDLHAQCGELVGPQPLDCGLRTDGHEHGCIDHTVRCGEPTHSRAGRGVRCGDVEIEGQSSLASAAADNRPETPRVGPSPESLTQRVRRVIPAGCLTSPSAACRQSPQAGSLCNSAGSRMLNRPAVSDRLPSAWP